VVTGQSGIATVTGTKSATNGVSCGTDCVSSSNTANLTIVFNDYLGPGSATNTRTRITGTVVFTDNRSTRQQGLVFSSSGSMSAAISSAASVRYEITSSVGQVYGYADTVTMQVSGRGSWDGWLRASNGVTYNF
jgi:hypothetical protein